MDIILKNDASKNQKILKNTIKWKSKNTIKYYKKFKK